MAGDPLNPGTSNIDFATSNNSAVGLVKALKSLYDVVDDVDDGIKKLNTSANQSANSIQNFVDSISNFTSSLGNLVKAQSTMFKKIGDSIPILGNVKTAIDQLAIDAIQATSAMIEFQVTMSNQLGSAFDSLGAGVRAARSDMREFLKGFGSNNLDEAIRFTEAFSDMAERGIGKANNRMFVSIDELKKMRSAMANSNMGVEAFNATVSTGGETLDLYTASILQASAMGMQFESHAKLMGNAVMKQGLSFEDALQQIASYSVISEETGLNIGTVSNGLEQATSQFNKIGMTASFARSTMLGFSDSLGEVGLGIENAVDLTTQFTGAIGKVVNSYDLAYFTSVMSGQEFGGGALGASIELQGQMMDAQKAGGGAQAEFGLSMAQAMRDTLTGITGGDIVTLQEARQSPELQTQFFTQQQTLQGVYGMQGDSATRTLEMLSKLNEALEVGDIETASKLQDQIKNEKEGRNELVDKMELQNRISSAMLQQLMIQNSSELLRLRGASQKYFDAGFKSMFGMSTENASSENIGFGLAQAGLGLAQGQKSTIELFEEGAGQELLKFLEISPEVFATIATAQKDSQGELPEEVKTALQSLGFTEDKPMKQHLEGLQKSLTDLVALQPEKKPEEGNGDKKNKDKGQ